MAEAAEPGGREGEGEGEGEREKEDDVAPIRER